jgi:hypothetical protein
MRRTRLHSNDKLITLNVQVASNFLLKPHRKLCSPDQQLHGGQNFYDAHVGLLMLASAAPIDFKVFQDEV